MYLSIYLSIYVSIYLCIYLSISLSLSLRTRRFSEPTFRPSGATNHWKNTVFRDFPTFSRICIFCPLTLSLLTLLTSAFQLSIFSEVSLLNFLRSVKVPVLSSTIFALLMTNFMHSFDMPCNRNNKRFAPTFLQCNIFASQTERLRLLV